MIDVERRGIEQKVDVEKNECCAPTEDHEHLQARTRDGRKRHDGRFLEDGDLPRLEGGFEHFDRYDFFGVAPAEDAVSFLFGEFVDARSVILQKIGLFEKTQGAEDLIETEGEREGDDEKGDRAGHGWK